MDSASIGLRAQDFHEALRDYATFGPKEAQFGKTILVGKTAVLAMHLKGIPYIDDIQSLQYVASSLGINFIELDRVLNELEHLDFIRVVREHDMIKRVDVRVPEFRNGYKDLGDRLLELKPSETELAGIRVLEGLLIGPQGAAELDTLGLDSPHLAAMRDVMRNGELMREQTIQGKKLIYSPLAVDANPAAYLQWATKHKDDVGKLISTLSKMQGLAIIDESIAGNSSLLEAIETGVLMPVRISGATGEQKFVFAPRGGLDKMQRTIIDKARAILACVRYGQRFAEHEPIHYPRSILTQLRDAKGFKKGHPDIRSQYGLLVEKTIGTIVQTRPGFFNFKLLDTPENVLALNTAIEMIDTGGTITAGTHLGAQQELLKPHGYVSPLSSRPRLAKEMETSEETRADIIQKLGNLARGVSNG